MKVLVIGGGGKEHAIVWKLSRSKYITKIYCCPGNAGIAEIAECIDVSPNDLNALIDFVKYEWIDFTIVGSEKFSTKDIINSFERESCRILGPNRTALQARSSRVFEKNIMRLHRIPTAEYKIFNSFLHAQDYVRLKGTPLVIRADGRSEENGVFIAYTVEEAIDVLKLILKEKILGDDGKQIIIEEKLKGERVSFVGLTDGTTIIPLTSIYIYRGIFHNDKFSSTIAMGAYSPVYTVTKELETTIMEKIMVPLVKALNSDGKKYKGFISADLVVNKVGVYIFEFDCCFGGLEVQTTMPRIRTDFTDIVLAIMEERLSDVTIEWQQGASASACIVISSRGYSRKHKKGIVIRGLEKIGTLKDTFVFHENTSFSNSDVLVSGSKALSIVSTAADIKNAKFKAYNALNTIHFEGMQYRKDIGDNII